MTHRALYAFAHVAPFVRRIALVVPSLLLLVATGYAVRAHLDLERLTLRSAERERDLALAAMKIRVRDSTLTVARARVDTVFVPVTRFVVVKSDESAPLRNSAAPRLETQLSSASIDVERVDAGARACAASAGTSPSEASSADSAHASIEGRARQTQHAALSSPVPRTLAADAAYFSLLATADLGNAWLHIDRDRGGYLDVWNTQDKLAHAAMGAVLSMSAIDAGVRPPWAVALTCAGAAGFEWSQGYASRKDLIAGCAGAAVGAGIRWGASKLPGRPR